MFLTLSISKTDVTPTSAYADTVIADEQRVVVPLGTGIVGQVAQSGITEHIDDAYADKRFNRQVDEATGYRTRCLMCAPVFSPRRELVGVAMLINKTDGSTRFTGSDSKLFEKFLTFGAIAIQKAELLTLTLREYKRNQMLLGMAHALFDEGAYYKYYSIHQARR